MAKKQYKGIVIREFKTGGVKYKVGDPYKTTRKVGYDHLITTKRIKQ